MDKKELVNIFTVDKPNVCFIGDIHGEFQSLNALMKKSNFHDALDWAKLAIKYGKFESSSAHYLIFNILKIKGNNEYLILFIIASI